MGAKQGWPKWTKWHRFWWEFWWWLHFKFDALADLCERRAKGR